MRILVSMKTFLVYELYGLTEDEIRIVERGVSEEVIITSITFCIFTNQKP